MNKVRKIPALTLSGGRLSDFKSRVVSYRIWVYFREEREDGYYDFLPNEFRKAKVFRKLLLKDKKYAQIEPVIAVIWDRKFKRYREVLNK